MNTKKITARRLTAEDVAQLGVADQIFVSASTEDLSFECHAPASLTRPGKDFEGGSFVAKTVFGETVHVLPDSEEEPGVWVEDGKGEEIEVLESAGVLLDLALFVPGGDAESLGKLYAAARKAFGEGVVQRWSEDSVAVPDVKIDLFEERARGRKSASSERDRRFVDIYPTRAKYLEPSDGWRFVQELHKPVVDDTPTI
ncbi:hypothetical protein [Streptomyces fuscigenes]|uniref:hypothetical protein n=1 Tax=Streptomyces fuscigenes TaxID=1528880 RepID=UPI001F2A3797|nr:hypothetical protein [Streptomyces fuscigenes]MCF3962625.1 hypothetical protein [Streptomyces fuscigenes]